MRLSSQQPVSAVPFFHVSSPQLSEGLWLMGTFGEALKYKLNSNLTLPLLPLVSVHYVEKNGPYMIPFSPNR